jgi:hypothetical protein
VGGFRPVSGGILALKLSERVWSCLEHVDGGGQEKRAESREPAWPEVVIFVEL